MSYLVWINEATNEVLHPQLVKLIPSFKILDNSEMLYVVLFSDYNSPYKQLPEHERKRRAMWHSFESNESELIDSAKIQIAIKDYMTLQHDPKQELIKTLQSKVDYFSQQLTEGTTSKDIKAAVDSITLLRQNILSLQSEVSEQVRNNGVVKGDQILSFIESVRSNPKQYAALFDRK